MKAKIKFIALGAAIVALGACSSDEEAATIPQGSLPADSVIRITTNVNNLVATRANDAKTYEGDSLGLYIKPQAAAGWTNVPGDAYKKYIYANITFLKKGGEWLPDSAGLGKMLWKGETEKYEYHAFAPADRGAAGDEHSTFINLAGQKDFIKTAADSLKYDLLYATKTDYVSNLLDSDGKLPVDFNHMMCKVKVILDSIGDEFYQNNNTINPIESIAITTSNSTVGMNIESGVVTGDGVPCELAFDMNAATHTAGATTAPGKFETTELFYPPLSEKFTIKIWTKDGRLFKYTHPEQFSFESGYIYTITLKMGKDVVQGNAGISIGEWLEWTYDPSLETE